MPRPQALKDLGVTATVVNCDVTERDAVTRLFETASGLGTVRLGDPHRGGQPQHG